MEVQAELDQVKKELLRATNEHDTVLAVVRSQRDVATLRYNEQAAQLRALEKSGVTIPQPWAASDSVTHMLQQRDRMKHELEEIRARHAALLKQVTEKEMADAAKPARPAVSPASVFSGDGDFKSHGEMTLIAKAIDTQWAAVREWLDSHFGTRPFVWRGPALYRQIVMRLEDAHIMLQAYDSTDTVHLYTFCFRMEKDDQ